MNLEHMRRVCGWNFQVLGAAELANYEFGPDTRGYANIRPKVGSVVFGVLFGLKQEALDALDEFEGYPEVFNRVEVTVKSEFVKEANAWVYMENAEFFGGNYIKPGYLKRVISGAVENRLPQTWMKFLESFHKEINI